MAAWADDAHVDEQRERYRRRLDAMATALAKVGRRRAAPRRRLLPVGPRARRRRVGAGPPPGRDGRRPRVARASSTARRVPGFVRVAVVQPDDRIALVAERLASRRLAPSRRIGPTELPAPSLPRGVRVEDR